MTKYVTKTEQDIWGNDVRVTRPRMDARDVGSMIGAGIGMAAAARQDAKMNALMATVQAAGNAIEAGNWEAAIAQSNQLIASSDADAQVIGHGLKGRALMELERYDEAINDCTSLINGLEARGGLGQFASMLLTRGTCHLHKKEKDIGAALRDFSAYIRLEPGDDNGYFMQAVALVHLGDSDQALNSITRAITINPGGWANYMQRADILVDRGETEKAIEDLTKAVTLKPQDAYSYRRRAALYDQKNDIQRAIADYSRAIELAPSDMDSYRARADLHRRAGDIVSSDADIAKVNFEKPLKETYAEYLAAAEAAYSKGMRATYTKADGVPRSNWWPVIGKSVVVGGIAMMAAYIVGPFIALSSNSAAWGYSYNRWSDPRILTPFFIAGGITLLFVLFQVISTRNAAIKRVKEANEHLSKIHTYEGTMPGFEEFFKQFLQAKQASKMQELPTNTHSFFEVGPGNQAVRTRIAQTQTAAS